jgi:hypothetical protein
MKYFEGKNLIIFILVLSLAYFIMQYYFMYKEGFQNSAQTTSNTPASCNIIKSIIERMNENLVKAKEANDTNAISNIEASLVSVNAEMAKMKC